MLHSLLFIVILVLCSAPARADGVDWKKALDRPLSPGTVAIVAEEGHRPEVQEAWRAALANPAPRIRAAAARAVYAANATPLLPDVARALKSETDPQAAEEESRALAVLDPSSSDALMAAAKRFPRLRRALGDLLGRVRGPEGLESYAALRDIDDEDGTLRRAFLAAATHDGRAGLAAAGAAVLREGDAVGWDAYWYLVRSDEPLDSALVVASLRTGPKLRAISYWRLAIELQRIEPLPPAVEEALRAVPEAQTPAEGAESPADADLVFAFELLRRARRETAQENLAWARSVTNEKPLPGPIPPVSRLFTDAERRVIAASKRIPRSHEAAAYKTLDKSAPALTYLNAYSSFPAGYVTGLVAEAECRPKAATEARARITYDRFGRVQEISAARFDMSDECAQVAKILFVSSHLPSMPRRSEAAADGTRVVHIGFLEREELSCLAETEARQDGEEAESSEGDPIRVGGHIKDPKKVRHVPPNYPSEARGKRIQGVVILETTLSPCGNVSEVEILRGVDGLNQAAADAVRKWRFTPTLLNGRPVPVIYTVTVNFALQ